MFTQEMGKGMNEEFFEYVEDIIHHPAVLQMKEYPHHGNTSCYEHCLHVAYETYRICKRFGLDARSAARAGMIHDLFLYDWHTRRKKTGKRFHGITHPRECLKNAEQYFELSDLEKEIIRRHMWPVTLLPPRHAEAWIITFTDKYCGTKELIYGSFVEAAVDQLSR